MVNISDIQHFIKAIFLSLVASPKQKVRIQFLMTILHLILSIKETILCRPTERRQVKSDAKLFGRKGRQSRSLGNCSSILSVHDLKAITLNESEISN